MNKVLIISTGLLFAFGANAFANQKHCTGEGLEVLIDIAPDKLTVTEIQGKYRDTISFAFVREGKRKNGTPIYIYEGYGLENQPLRLTVDTVLEKPETTGLLRIADIPMGGDITATNLNCTDVPAGK